LEGSSPYLSVKAKPKDNQEEEEEEGLIEFSDNIISGPTTPFPPFIRCVARYAARLGQCFSSTRTSPGLKIDGKVWTVIRDLHTKCGHYTFTDGVGIISRDMAVAIASEALDMNREHHRIPSAYQIRFGGFKGERKVQGGSGGGGGRRRRRR